MSEKTIIIGGGVSGLACARSLAEAGESFLLISPEIGGRISTSDDGKVNYGAWYVGSDYKHVLSLVKLGRKVKKLGVVFHHGIHSYTLLSMRLAKHPLEILRFLKIIFKFKRAFHKLLKDSETRSQKDIIENDPYLQKLYNMSAIEFCRVHKIQHIVDDYIAELLQGTTWAQVKDISAFAFLQFSLPFVVSVYKFTFLKDKSILPFSKRIIYKEVTIVERDSEDWVIRTSDGTLYRAENVVVATPIQVSQKLLRLPKINEGFTINTFHMAGSLKPFWEEGEEELLGPLSDVLSIADEAHGTYLFCSKTAAPDFGKYFDSWNIIKHIYWNPAFSNIGFRLLANEQGPNCYLIGDFNVSGLEAAYTTGIYAANQIIKSSSEN